MSGFKACTAIDTTPGSPRCQGRPPGPGTMATPAASCSQVGLVFRPAGLFTIAAGAAKNPPGNCFSPTPPGIFCTPWAGSSFAAFIKGDLLNRSTARYFYKRLKTSLHKPRGNLIEILFSKKCTFKNNLQLLEKEFLSQTNTTLKNGILFTKWLSARIFNISVIDG
jgi:hypothetical protein